MSACRRPYRTTCSAAQTARFWDSAPPSLRHIPTGGHPTRSTNPPMRARTAGRCSDPNAPRANPAGMRSRAGPPLVRAIFHSPRGNAGFLLRHERGLSALRPPLPTRRSDPTCHTARRSNDRRECRAQGPAMHTRQISACASYPTFSAPDRWMNSGRFLSNGDREINLRPSACLLRESTSIRSGFAPCVAFLCFCSELHFVAE
jgi:hypothetical protein